MANTVTRYQPQNSVTRLPDMVDRLFKESFVMPSVFDSFAGGAARPGLPVNLFETEDGYTLQAALPGIKAEDVDISVTGREVTIKGSFGVTFPLNITWIWQGIPNGEFREIYTLPVEVDGAKVEATYEYGILSLTLPKAEHLKPKNIKISVSK